MVAKCFGAVTVGYESVGGGNGGKGDSTGALGQHG